MNAWDLIERDHSRWVGINHAILESYFHGVVCRSDLQFATLYVKMTPL